MPFFMPTRNPKDNDSIVNIVRFIKIRCWIFYLFVPMLAQIISDGSAALETIN